MKYIVLIPAYRPEGKLIELLKKIPKDMDIVIVDDGSGGEYASIFSEARRYGHVISYDNNSGKGHALKIGFKYIHDNYHKYVVVTMDADGQHDVNDAIKVASYANECDNVLVLGRRTWNSKTPFLSRFGNAITRLVFRLKTGLRIYDTQTGLRAFSYKLMPYMLDIPGDRFEYEMNVLLNLCNNSIKYHEIGIKTIYFDGNKKSHFKAIKDSFQIYKQIFKFKKTR